MAYKEIVTKAVIAKGKKNYKNKYQVEVEQQPTTILGCWIINHNFQGKENNNKVLITGSFDANIWYSFDNDTKTTVVTKTINYQEEEALNTSQQGIANKDIIIRSLKQPTCISAKEEGNTINIEIEKELGIEIIGDTKVKISSVDDVDDTWDLLGTTEENELNKINENYINEEISK